MSYFKPDESNFSAVPPPVRHRVKDAGFLESFGAASQNTLGVLEEDKITLRRRNAAASWALSQADDEMRQRMVDNPETDPMVFINELAERGVEIPPGFSEIANWQELEDAAIDDFAKEYLEREEILSRSTTAGKVGGFLGSIAGSLDDDENFLTLPLGVPGRLGIAATIIGEGVINAGIEGAVFNQRKALLDRMGVQDDQTIWQAMGYGALFGAGFAGTVAVAPKVLGGASRVVATPFTAGRRILSRKPADQVADILIESDLPEVVATGYAVKSDLEIRSGAIEQGRRATATQEGRLAYDAAEPLLLTQRVAPDRPADDPALRDDLDLQEDADFLNDVTAGRVEFPVGNIEPVQLAPDRVAVPVLTSDDVTQRLDVPAKEADQLIARFEAGEAIPIRELDAMGVKTDSLDKVRPIIDYYDKMDARFRGQSVPDEFDPIDDGPDFDLNAQAPFREDPTNLDVADFGDNLSRLASEIQRFTGRQEGRSDGAVTPLEQTDSIQGVDDNGNVVTKPVGDVIKEIEEDLAAAEAAKVCLL